MAYGNIVTASDMKSALKDITNRYGRKNWSELYASVDLASQQAEAALKYNYAQQISEAYDTSREQLATVYGSNLGSGYKQAKADELSQVLEEAYSTYMSQYQTNASTVQENIAESYDTLNSQLSTQADYAAKYINSTLPYLSWLEEQLGQEELLKDPTLSQYYYIDDNGAKQLMTAEQMQSTFFDSSTGELNTEGLQYFDVIHHLKNNDHSFTNYLRSEASDVLDWSTSVDPVSGMTNVEQIRQTIGLDDYKYDSFDYMTDAEITAMFDKYKSDVSVKSLTEFAEATDTSVDDLLPIANNIEQLQSQIDKLKEPVFTRKATSMQELRDMLGIPKNKLVEDIDLDERRRTLLESTREKLSEATTELNTKYNELYSTALNNAKASRKYTDMPSRVKGLNPANYSDLSKSKNGVYQIVDQKDNTVYQFASTSHTKYDIKNKKNRNANIAYNGTEYRIEMTDDTLSGKTDAVARALINSATGRDAQLGDIVIIKNVAYILTEANVFRGFKNRSGSQNDLLKAIQQNAK